MSVALEWLSGKCSLVAARTRRGLIDAVGCYLGLPALGLAARRVWRVVQESEVVVLFGGLLIPLKNRRRGS